MNELADRLVWGRHLCGMTPTEAEAILKALRFAADMERLVSCDVQIERGDQPGDEWLITVWRDGEEIQTSDKDIYTAARKAVEELEKGEGDARHKD